MFNGSGSKFLHAGVVLLIVFMLAFGVSGIQVARAAGFVVSNTNDSGAGSLRDAIDQANASTGADTITFSISGTILLASTLPAITDPAGLTIDGAGQTITISGNNTVQIITVNNGASLTVDSLTIANGNWAGFGGGIFNAGTLTIASVTFSGNSASIGGGILNNGTLNIANSVFNGNSAGDGGGIANSGTLTVTNSTLSSNSASTSGGGIYNVNAGTLTVTNSTLSSNSAGDGGGIRNDGDSMITSVTFSGNSAGDGGGILNNGTLSITNSTFSGNSATNNSGGGIFQNGGTLSVTNSTFSGNSATTGGGIRNNSNVTLTVTNSTFSGNNAAAGGGIYNIGIMTVANSTFSSNTSNWGGGIYHQGASGVVTNSTFFNNSASTFSGGGIDSETNLTVRNSTFSGNSAPSGGGLYNHGTLNFINTILANSTSGGDCVNGATISNNINNLVEDGSCSTGGVNFKTGDPNLGSLADNGGPTQTMALLSGSPAIDAGDDAICAAAPVNNLDQRGVARPWGTHCDIGAYELETKIPTQISLTPVFSTVYINEPVVLHYAVTYDQAKYGDHGTPSGNVTVSDNWLFNCTGTVADGQCTITFTDPSFYPLTATYEGDGNFLGSVSESQPIEVTCRCGCLSYGGSSGTTITSASPDPSLVGAPVLVKYTVLVNSSTGTYPATDGDVIVSDGVDSNTCTAASGQCALTLTTPGVRTIQASYQGFDGCGISYSGSSASITHTVTPLNSAPTANNDSYSTNEDTTLTVAAPGVLANDTDPDTGDTLTAVLVSGPSNAASFTLNSDGSFSYTPSANYNGSDSFSYKARDSQGAESSAATVSINIAPVNDAPTVLIAAGGACGSGANGTMNLTLADVDSPIGNITLSGSSSNTGLIPNANIVFGGSNPNRTVTITAVPQKTVKTATVTITVKDNVQAASSITVTVTVGTDKNETINGTSGADMIFGMNGNNIINGNDGNDLICGGNGVDTVSGGGGDDTIDGANGNDVLSGNDGNDILRGNLGDDKLTGNAGADYFSGGAGNDVNADFNVSQGDTGDGT